MHLVVALGGSVIMFLGLAHLVFTLRSTPQGGPLSPTDPAVRSAMSTPGGIGLAPAIAVPLWRSWVGFNLSHSLGVLAVGAYIAVPALVDFDGALDRIEWLVPAVALPLVYLAISIRCWFDKPTRGIALAATLIVVGIVGGLMT